MKEDFLKKKLTERKEQNSFRTLRVPEGKIDFCSNDYLGIVKNDLLKSIHYKQGSTGSRLLSGNYPFIEETEKFIADFHDAEAGLIFNSGYDANIGLLSCVPQKGDTILYDQLIHASIRDGIRLSFAQSFSFIHNDLEDLEKKLKIATNNIFIVTESVFSMDGDFSPLIKLIDLNKKYKGNLIVDEAHATGVIGEKGEGLVQQMKLHHSCFARVHTFGKACGVHGAIVLGSNDLRNYLINFARPFIFSTALPAASIHSIKSSYQLLPKLNTERKQLDKLIDQFQFSLISGQRASNNIIHTSCIQHSTTPIQVVIIPGNEEVKKIAIELQKNDLDVRAILYPTVPKGSERLRIVLHSFNTTTEVSKLAEILTKNIF